jgi:hypothetical protein
MPIPYGVIRTAWRSGNVVPFVGAGASLVGRSTPNEQWTLGCPFLPSAAELAAYLAGESGFPSTDLQEISDLAKVSSYCALRGGKRGLAAALRAVFCCQVGKSNFKPGVLHRYVASVPCMQLIITTNYDDLLETAFRDAGTKFDLMVYPADNAAHSNEVMWQSYNEERKFVLPDKLPVDFDHLTRTIIYKMHGSIADIESFDSFVITEEDYVSFLYRMTTRTAIPPLVLEFLADKSLLFLGYGLKDWNLRLIQQNLSGFLAERARKRVAVPSWAIQKAPSAVDEELWKSRNVQIFSQDVEAFAAAM